MSVVLAHGTFDLLHYGHLCFLKAAKRLGEILVVSVTADEFVKKGPGRPIYNEYERGEMLRALRFVDHVFICRERTGLQAIEQWRPRIYAKGRDYLREDKHGALQRERAAVEKLGGELVIVDSPLMSSTSLIERIAKWKEKNEALAGG